MDFSATKRVMAEHECTHVSFKNIDNDNMTVSDTKQQPEFSSTIPAHAE